MCGTFLKRRPESSLICAKRGMMLLRQRSDRVAWSRLSLFTWSSNRFQQFTGDKMVCSFLEIQAIRRHEEYMITLFMKDLMQSGDAPSSAERGGRHNLQKLDRKQHWDRTGRDNKASPSLTHMHNVKANSNSGFSHGTEPSRKRSDSLRSTAVTEINKV